MRGSNMALHAGTRLGPYEVLSLIGAGGMGEVYRARDPRLDREVAIKVLPAERVADEDRRRRFVQEAKAASALNHPHIITIHEIESAGGNDFIVMEYVRGKGLDALIPRHGMRVGEALRIAIPVADALTAAHARGIIHRDLKPANVVVATDGAVKVLDFGLAKLIGADDASDVETPTVTGHAALSGPGTVAGTAAYMAPEQAMGGTVDVRSDIFSFGAMLYEMVTGARAFAGTSTADTLSAVVRAQPKAPSAIVPGIPNDLEKLILRCLRKDPQRRFQHIDDVKVALQDIKEESDSGVAPPGPVGHTRRSALTLAVIGAMLVVAAVGAWLLRRAPQVPAVTPRVVPLTTLSGEEFDATFSPDGDQVAFSWKDTVQDTSDIYVTLVGSSDVRRLTSDPLRDVNPVWAPDGRQIAFLRERPDGSSIQLVSAVGGADRKLSDFKGADSLAWSPDGQWLATGRSEGTAQERGIYFVPADGGATRRLVGSSSPTVVDSHPAFSPDGRRLAYVSCSYSEVFRTAMGGCDVSLIELNAAATAVLERRQLTQQRSVLVSSLAWTRDGTALIYSRFTQPWLSHLWRVGADSGRPPERIEIAGPNATAPAIAPSRDRLAFTRFAHDMDIHEFDRGRPARLLSGSSFVEQEPRLSPDGRRLAFSSARAGGDTSQIERVEVRPLAPEQQVLEVCRRARSGGVPGAGTPGSYQGGAARSSGTAECS
jgi:serine/threonine protein kinase